MLQRPGQDRAFSDKETDAKAEESLVIWKAKVAQEVGARPGLRAQAPQPGLSI